MILLILFYSALVIVAGLLIAVGFSFYLKRRELPAPQDRRINLYPPHPEVYRPLFAPSPDEVRAQERAEDEARLQTERAARAEAARQILREKSVKAQDFMAAWQGSPEKQGTAELLRLAAGTESAEIFSEIAQNVIQVWKNKEIAGMPAADLAALLDSHLRLLPQQELNSGALFWLRQEVAALRSENME
jgi:hypothetical protein